MAVWDLFSKREERKQKQGQADVFQYEKFPQAFRVQVIHVLMGALGRWRDLGIYESETDYPPNQWWRSIFQTICRERGCFALTTSDADTPFAQCCTHIGQASASEVLDLIEVAFHFIQTEAARLPPYYRKMFGLTQQPEEAVRELNTRFREHRIGYKLEAREIMRVDSEHLHTEAVKPALHLLNTAGKNFAGPLQEFLEAHTKYRKGDFKMAMLTASHAFESTLKAICTERRWAFEAHKDTANKLIEIVIAKGLIPPHMQGQFQGLRGLLESGPQIPRNKTPGVGHGQGTAPIEPPEHLVRYAMNLAASNIVFLIESHQALR